MLWNSPAEFFTMGGYGLYVWGSFGVCVLTMLIEPLLVRQRRQRAIRQIQQNQDDA